MLINTFSIIFSSCDFIPAVNNELQHLSINHLTQVYRTGGLSSDRYTTGPSSGGVLGVRKTRGTQREKQRVKGRGKKESY